MAQPSDFDGQLFRAKDVRQVCGISARQLDYWIDRDVVRPTVKKNVRRPTFLFTFRDIVQIRIIKSLRDQGISLREVGAMLRRLRKDHGDMWQHAWLVAFGKDICLRRDDEQLESLSTRDRGQLVFAVVALGRARRDVARSLGRVLRFTQTRSLEARRQQKAASA